MSYSPEQQARIDTYLMALRRSLGDLGAEDVNEILREIRGHILERTESSSGEVTNDRLVKIMSELGRAEDIGPLYQDAALVSRARSSLSPSLILRTTMRWGMTSLRGFSVFFAGLIGYGMALGFLVCAILKPFLPNQVGAWISPAGFSMGAVAASPHAHEILGWWIIPFALAAAALSLVLTTRTLRWTLRFATPRVS